MRIGFVSTASTWGGGERLLLQLTQGCVAAGADVTLAAPARSELIRRVDPAIGVALPGKARGPAALWRLRREFGAEYDAVVLNDPHAITYAGAALAGLSVSRIGVRHTCFPLKSVWKHTHLVDHVVCVSDSARQNCLEAGLKASRTSVIHGGLTPQTPTAEQLDSARSDLAWGDAAEPLCLAIGSLLPVKGLDTLIHALAEAKHRGEGFRLAIAGDGPERQSLQQLAQRLGVADRLRLLGFRDDVPALLRVADLFVNASHNEGLSLVLIEAMHAGTPIVSTDVGGSCEVLGSRDVASAPVARVFTPGDPIGALDAITETQIDVTGVTERVSAGRHRAAELFSVEAMVIGYIDLIARLNERRAPRAA